MSPGQNNIFKIYLDIYLVQIWCRKYLGSRHFLFHGKIILNVSGLKACCEYWLVYKSNVVEFVSFRWAAVILVVKTEHIKCMSTVIPLKSRGRKVRSQVFWISWIFIKHVKLLRQEIHTTRPQPIVTVRKRWIVLYFPPLNNRSSWSLRKVISIYITLLLFKYLKINLINKRSVM